MSNPNPIPPKNKGRKVCKVNAMTLANLLKALQEGIYTCQELSDETGLHYVTVLTYMREFHKAGIIYIKAWESDSRGRDQTRIFCFGNKPDKPKKPRATVIEKSKRYREKRQQAKMLHRIAGSTETRA